MKFKVTALLAVMGLYSSMSFAREVETCKGSHIVKKPLFYIDIGQLYLVCGIHGLPMVVALPSV